MPSWISKGGIWEPAIERAVIGKRGEEHIYEGPDRAAMEELKNAGVTSFGQHYSQDPEMIMRARQLNYKDVEEYLSMYNYNKADADKAYEVAKATLVTHADPPKKVSVKTVGGGADTAGGAGRTGAFGKPAEHGGGKD